jgi:cytochrome c
MKLTIPAFVIVLLSAFVLSSCGGESDEASDDQSEEVFEVYAPKAEIGPEGIGPIKEALILGPIDNALAIQGDTIFTSMCTSCHKMEKRHVGPALHGVLERHSPAWIMNMILNPEVMVKEDPVAKKLFAEYLSPMANQNLTEAEARAVLEYFRKFAEENPTK